MSQIFHHQMFELNRSAIVVRPKGPFLEWLHSVDPNSSEFTLQDMCQEPTVYLIRECESEEDSLACLEEIVSAVFEDQLEGWWRDRSAWPANRTLDLFHAWFNCQFHSLVLDAYDTPPEEY